MNPTPNINVTSETSATVMIDGDQAPGVISMRYAMNKAISKAKSAGVGWALVRQTTHSGALGYYTKIAAEEVTNKAQNNMVNPYVKISTSYSLSCSDAWGLVCNKDDYLEDHRHDPSMFSFVYYVNSPKGSSPLVFRTSGHEVNPEAGKVVIFNSRLLHEIPPNNCNGRYSFVGNLSAV